MLFVDDGDGEIGEVDVALDQCVRADGDLGDAVRDLGPDLLRADRAREQHAAHTELRADRLEGQEVLLGERLRRRHQRALSARFNRPQERVERDHGLARADVALQQPLHRRCLSQVEIDLHDRALLMLRQLERQHGAVAVDQPPGPGEARRDRIGVAQPRHDQLQRHELIEREPPAAALDELVTLQLIVARLRDTDAVAPCLARPGGLIDRYRAVLPFQLTEHQERAIMEIDLDLAQTTPMQRLLQGDVGSGKTVVALYALLRR